MSDNQTRSMIPPEKERVEKMYLVVHEAVRRLKMGEEGYIICTEFSVDSVRSYLWAYAFHKKKWFDTEYDATNKILTATRAPAPPWDDQDSDDDQDEEL